MNNKTGSEIELEILVATMNRNSLRFLDDMFVNNDISKLNLLIINQTTEDCLLKSENSNIRVINSFEKGLSRSRNLALQNALGNICLIADDDVIYLKDFNSIISKAFLDQKNADVITFKTLTTEKKPYYNYPNDTVDVKQFYRKVLSIEIAFRRDSILSKKVFFDENFGLGSTFEDCENVFFLKEVFSKDLNAKFEPNYIVIHAPRSSSDDVTSDRYFFARSAMYYKSYGRLAYFYIVKLILSLLRKGLLTFNQIASKWKVAMNGIEAYKQLKNN
jgi:glycosyltransferase involved in cell wall biosynthesis